MLYIKDGEPLTRWSLSDPLADFSDPLAISKTVGKNGNNYAVKKILSAYAVALKIFYLLFTPNSLFAES